MYRVLIHRAARKQLEETPRSHRDKIDKAIYYLAQEPLAGKKLQGYYQGHYGLRVWPYRIIYTLEKKKLMVLIIAIGHRQGVYHQ